MDYPVISPKKLIEVALPLDAINAAAAREKSIRHGHPSTLHLWWARRPLAAARAIIFSQLVNDPEDLWHCQNPGKEPNAQVKGHWTKARAKLFSIIEELVIWENTTNTILLEKTREEIRRSWRDICELNKRHPQAETLFNPDIMPAFHDPFAGGGTIPLEAQRLGLGAYASDLNPVAVLINKSLIEIPPKFSGRPPVNPTSKREALLIQKAWKGSEGLAEDIRYYGNYMRDEAYQTLANDYPTVKISENMVRDHADLKDLVGETVTVLAWLWARTVKSPNPAFSHVKVPLLSTFVLSDKPGQYAYLEPLVQGDAYSFKVRNTRPPAGANAGTKLSRGANFQCLLSGTPVSPDYIKSEGVAGRLGVKLTAAIALGPNGRVYLEATKEMENAASVAMPESYPSQELSGKSADQVPLYGMHKYSDIFTRRQLKMLSTLCDCVSRISDIVKRDAFDIFDDEGDLKAYGDAIALYLAFAVDKVAEGSTTLCTWSPLPTKLHVVSTFGRQALQMTWDFAEANPFADSSGNILRMTQLVANAIELQTAGNVKTGHASQQNATSVSEPSNCIVSTDPPYYDNICYADLSDFFYVWLRQSLRKSFPELFATMAVPKSEELIANFYRHKSRTAAETFFLENMTKAIRGLACRHHPAYPVTIYYAFRQSETTSDAGTSSTGWETFLEAVVRAGLGISGTWPVRTERKGGFRNKDQNALASSIVLVCNRRGSNTGTISRRQFVRELNATLPLALDAMTRESEGMHSPVAPVDLSQAIIGPGMAVFSKYRSVLEADGSAMSVRSVMQLINRFLAEDDFDADTQFCLHWFEQYGWESGKFGEADTLARAKGTSVDGVKHSGVLHSGGGNVRLLKWAEYPSDWDPQADQRLPIWEVLHQLIRVFNTDGETGAAAVFVAVQSKAEAARQLAYRLYTLCERSNRAEDARAYNEVVTSWSSIESAAAKEPAATQRTLFDE
jgi:putative DNA methylase